MKNRLDRIDRNILNQLQKNNQISNVDLADLVGLSPPACLRRTRRLRNEGIICADVALVAPEVAGQNINIVVEVEMERDHLEFSRHFKNEIQKAPEVTQCYSVTGEVDFILVVSVADMQAYDAFTERLLYSHPHMRKFRSLISLSRVKFETAVEL